METKDIAMALRFKGPSFESIIHCVCGGFNLAWVLKLKPRGCVSHVSQYLLPWKWCDQSIPTSGQLIRTSGQLIPTSGQLIRTSGEDTGCLMVAYF